MAQTPPDITVTTADWLSLNTASGFAVGTAFSVLNKSTHDILLSEGTKPTADSLDGVFLLGVDTAYAFTTMPTGSLEVWARAISDDATIVIQGE